MAAEEAKPLDYSSDASVVKLIGDRFEGTPAPTEPNPEQTEEATPEATTEVAQEAQAESPEQTESPSESTEQPEAAPALPETLEDLAAAYGVEPDKLLETIKGKVKVDGQERVVNLGEALKGYQLESDYRKKTAEVAEQRRQLDEVTQQAVRSLDARLTAAETLENFLRQEVGLLADPTELDRLFETDRDAYDRRKREIERKAERFQIAQNERQRLQAEQAQQTQAQIAQKRTQEIERFLALSPDLNNEAKQAEFEKQTGTFLESIGFSKKEVAAYLTGAWDHRQMLLIRKAMKADEIASVQNKVAPILKNVPKMVRPGAARAPGERTDKREDTRARLHKNPTTENALEYLKARIR